ncbi:MAG TPA: DUF3147 family protein [Polyangia bacterium]|nr:DUF3147 family protein [Polyangia bacterium]
MKIRFDAHAVKESSWLGHLLRFVAGGIATVAVGVFTKATDAKAGGLMLAIPSIVPLGIALLARTEKQKPGATSRGDRGRHAATVEATGAAFGTIGLLAFAIVAWQLLLRTTPWIALPAATLAWAAVATGVWLARKSHARP